MSYTNRKSTKRSKRVFPPENAVDTTESPKQNDKKLIVVCTLLVLGVLIGIAMPSQNKVLLPERKQLPSLEELERNKDKLLPLRFKTEVQSDSSSQKTKETWTILDVRKGIFGCFLV